MSLKSITVTLSLSEIIQKEAEFTEDLKKLSNKFAITASKTTYQQIERKEANLKTLKLARLKLNQDINNNPIIIELDILTKKREILNKLLNMDKKRNIFNYIKSLISWKKYFSKDEVEKKLTTIAEHIESFKKDLSEINNTNKVEVVLL
jgi:hypothetical protein